jgi:hypothetical protein
VIDAFKHLIQFVRQYYKSYRDGKWNTVYEILHDADHLNVVWLTGKNKSGNKSFQWDDAILLTVFKRDLFAVDRICLEIELKNGESIEIDEEMKGWDSLVQKLPEYLPGCQSFGEWFDVVAFPAFELNETRIFERVAETGPK